MNRKLARIIVCLMDEKLNLPSMVLESIEENLVKGKFDKVLDCYRKRIIELKGDSKMKRMFGLMPSNEVDKRKWYKDKLGLRIGIEAGKKGWTILWADGGTIYKDNIATVEDNFNEAYKKLTSMEGFEDIKEESREEICEEVCLEK